MAGVAGAGAAEQIDPLRAQSNALEAAAELYQERVVQLQIPVCLGKGETLGHSQALEAAGVRVTAVPAYNVTPGRTAYHPKERKDNGYLMTAGSGSDALHIYIAGDTEPIPEMVALGPVDIAFLPMNQPYTMTPEQAAAAARTIHPKILYPYHFGSTDTTALQKLLAANPEIEVRIRKLQ